MSVDYSGAIHSEVFGISESVNTGLLIHGEYRGQDVTLHPKTKSPIEQASEMEEYVVIRRQQKPKLRAREIRDKRRTDGQKKLCSQYIGRLDHREERQQQRNQRYYDCETKLKRLRQRVRAKLASYKNEDINGASDEQFDFEDLSIDGRGLSEIILEEVADMFPDVTEQDNFLEYFTELTNFESEGAASETRQAEKMIKRLDNRTDEKAINRREELRQRIASLGEEATILERFNRNVLAAREVLRSIHKQEIEDGYNLIPKAADLFASLDGEKISEEGDKAREVATAYQRALCTDDLPQLMVTIFTIFGPNGWQSGVEQMLELSGSDIKSINPSREPQHLIVTRDLIYRLINTKELHSWVGNLRQKILKVFSESVLPEER